ncbi:MAG TPA: hypothetical protein VFQ65_13615 [Kofleriaceae bacterium]|nr:hypothetical protein [Kofleriaceae bacterium]
MWRVLLPVFALSGCDVVFHIDAIQEGSGGGIPDAPIPTDGVAACSLVGKYGAGSAGLMRYCVHTDSTPLELGGAFDTTANQMCDYSASAGADMNPVCVVSARTIAVTTGLVVTGDKPLVLAALDTITIAAAVDLTGGPGEDPSACTLAGAGDGGASNSSGSAGGGGGGGGGGWQTKGGKGGLGKVGTAALGGGTTPTVVDIRGGCRGGTGGAGSTGFGGNGGTGGGAIYLTARTAIHISSAGSINASGRGGQGGAVSDGGAGGGGSGGLIAFDSPTVTFDTIDAPGAMVFANGGGGGAGGNAVGGAISMTAGIGATGGIPNGGTGAMANGPGGIGGAGSTNGGGGGGGGQGFIVVFSPMNQVVSDPSHISPPMIIGT